MFELETLRFYNPETSDVLAMPTDVVVFPVNAFAIPQGTARQVRDRFPRVWEKVVAAAKDKLLKPGRRFFIKDPESGKQFCIVVNKFLAKDRPSPKAIFEAMTQIARDIAEREIVSLAMTKMGTSIEKSDPKWDGHLTWEDMAKAMLTPLVHTNVQLLLFLGDTDADVRACYDEKTGLFTHLAFFEAPPVPENRPTRGSKAVVVSEEPVPVEL